MREAARSSWCSWAECRRPSLGRLADEACVAMELTATITLADKVHTTARPELQNNRLRLACAAASPPHSVEHSSSRAA